LEEEERGGGKGAEMTQTLYAHMNKIFKKRISGFKSKIYVLSHTVKTKEKVKEV
jgi:hypothetical protein